MYFSTIKFYINIQLFKTIPKLETVNILIFNNFEKLNCEWDFLFFLNAGSVFFHFCKKKNVFM